MPQNATILIPARYASTRYPGKPLAELRGATGVAKSLVRRSWEAACRVRAATSVYVTTDDTRIADAASGFGAEVLMTSETCRNGTERCAEAVALLPEVPDIVVNLQGDAPLTPPHYVEALIAAMTGDVAVATPVLETTGAHLARLQEDRRHGRVGGTTAVTSRSGHALYFSKEVVPFTAAAYSADEITPILHHVGVYAYTPEALRLYQATEPGPLEELEGLEQLRFLENGVPVACVPVDSGGRAFWELNNPSDVPIIEDALKAEGIV